MDRQRQYIHGDAASLVGSMCPSLYRAVYRGRTKEVMAMLLRPHGAATTDCRATGIIMHGQCNILEVTAEKNTLLHIAAAQGHGKLIRELYLRFEDHAGVLLSRLNTALDTPLHCAARAGHVGSVKALVELARDHGEGILGSKNEAGDTALHLAARHGHGQAVEVLMSAAAEPAAELNNAGMSPLYLAVMSGSVQAVRVITIGSDDASTVGPSSQNALHAAVFQSPEMVDLLLQWRPALADQVDSSGSSPLHFASSVGSRTIVNAILLAAPPTTVYKRDSGGLSALHVAARMGHCSVVRRMLELCPDAAELRDDDGGTFLHAAAREKRSKVVSLAIKKRMLRGLLDAQDRKGNTALHLAVVAGEPGIADALLRKGKVHVDVLNNDGHTPFDLAAGSNSFLTMVRLVVTLFTFGAHLRPQRQDHLKPWSGRDMHLEVEKTSDSLAVVAGLIIAAAFTAGFNVPGGYDGTTGKAELAGKRAFDSFLVLDSLAVATSVFAVILFVYGKVSRSASSWKSFAVGLQFLWVSLVSLMLAFYVAVAGVATTGAFNTSFKAIYWVMYTGMYVLQSSIMMWTSPAISWRTIWRFLWQPRHSKAGRVIVKHQYPFVIASIVNSCLFVVTSFIGLYGFGAIFQLGKGVGTSSHSPAAPSPL
ncbi:hypothetical protein U9M48_004718 [Paspalum notatum var. saurae]|uniref:PGG domain-containing protein n=1 Tax=Paspalum notatum var. saurae TaxID=547442 RepID=A0AAQ3SF11_PASNO